MILPFPCIPPGELTGLRLHILRISKLSQIGAALRRELRLAHADGRADVIPIRRSALGDNDATWKWTDLDLERPVRLTETTPGVLTLRAEPPRSFPTWYTFYLPSAPPGSSEYVGPLTYQGTIRDFCLSLAAVYAR